MKLWDHMLPTWFNQQMSLVDQRMQGKYSEALRSLRSLSNQFRLTVVQPNTTGTMRLGSANYLVPQLLVSPGQVGGGSSRQWRLYRYYPWNLQYLFWVASTSVHLF